MHPTKPPCVDEAYWDGRPKHRTPRFLRITEDSPTRLLRTAQADRCAACGNPIEWYERPTGRTTPLHPDEMQTALVPAGERWHVHSGVAQPADDSTRWCRIRHHVVCPTTTRDDHHRGDQLEGLRSILALNTRQLTESGILTPTTTPPPRHPPPVRTTPTRPVVHLLYLRYLAPGPLKALRCVTQTRTRRRCPHPVLAPDAPAGTWMLLPVNPRSGHNHQPPPSDGEMAVYDLTGLPHAEQLRWHAQRCTVHSSTPAAADTARTDWELFDPRAHHDHIQPHPPGF